MTDLEDMLAGRPKPAPLPGAEERPASDEDTSGQPPLTEPEAHAAFVAGLYARIEAKLGQHLDEHTQEEIAKLTRLVVSMRPAVLEQNRLHFEAAFDILAAKRPNLTVARAIRLELAAIQNRSGGGFARLFVPLAGETPLSAVISALTTIFLLSFVVILLTTYGHGLILSATEGSLDEVPILAEIKNVPMGQVLLLIHAAFIGSIVSVLARIRDFLSGTEFSALLIYVSVLTKPFVSVTFAILTYTVMKSGIVSFLGVNLDGSGGAYIAWALGFLCGFSERFAQDFVTSASSRFGEAAPFEKSELQRRSNDHDS